LRLLKLLNDYYIEGYEEAMENNGMIIPDDEDIR